MRKMSCVFLALVVAMACQQQRPPLAEGDRAAIADTVRRMVMVLFDAANHRDAGRFAPGSPCGTSCSRLTRA
jgi:hypothetical protein